MAKGAAKGTMFKIGETSATITVGSLSSIGGVALSADQIDVTSIDNTTGYREFIGGFKDGGEVSLSGFFDFVDLGQKALYEAFEEGIPYSCAIVFPEAISASWTFNGVVTAYETSAETEDAVTFDCTVKVSGKPTLA